MNTAVKINLIATEEKNHQIELYHYPVGHPGRHDLHVELMKRRAGPNTTIDRHLYERQVSVSG